MRSNEFLGHHALIVETTWKGPLSKRTAQHRAAILVLLRSLDMVAPKATEFEPFFGGRPRAQGKTRVAILDDAATRDVRHLDRALRATTGLVVRRLGSGDVRAGRLDAFDAVVVPSFAVKPASIFGDAERHALRRFVERGGGCVGFVSGLRLVPAGDKHAASRARVVELESLRKGADQAARKRWCEGWSDAVHRVASVSSAPER